MKRPGVISWDLLYGQGGDALKDHLLLYDELWVPWLKSPSPTKKEIKTWNLDEAHLASIAWLEEELDSLITNYRST